MTTALAFGATAGAATGRGGGIGRGGIRTCTPPRGTQSVLGRGATTKVPSRQSATASAGGAFDAAGALWAGGGAVTGIGVTGTAWALRVRPHTNSAVVRLQRIDVVSVVMAP